MAIIVGYDPGFGNTKVCIDGRVSIVQSAVARPRDIGMAAIGMRAAGRKVPIVEFGGARYAIGSGAWNRGELFTSLDYSALAGDARRALLYGTLAGYLPDAAEAELIVGLPVPLLADQAQATGVLAALRTLKGEHAFTLNGQPHGFVVTKLKVIPQPVGAYVDWLYDGEMRLRPGGSKAEVGVVDIGMNTLDLYALRAGEVVESFVGGAEVGAFISRDSIFVGKRPQSGTDPCGGREAKPLPMRLQFSFRGAVATAAAWRGSALRAVEALLAAGMPGKCDLRHNGKVRSIEAGPILPRAPASAFYRMVTCA